MIFNEFDPGQALDPAPVVTALIMVHNQHDFLRDTFSSVRAQTLFDQIRVVISDDASSDGSYELAQALAQDLPNVTVRRNSATLGVMPHYRHIIAQIDTELVAILEGDDVWKNPEKLEKQAAFFRVQPTLNCIFTGYTVVDEINRVESQRPRLLGGQRSGFIYFEELLQGNPIASFTNCMYRTSALLAALQNDASLTGYDWLVNLLIADQGPFGYLEGDFASYRIRARGTWSQLDNVSKIDAKIATLSAVAPHVGKRRQVIVESMIVALTKIKENMS